MTISRVTFRDFRAERIPFRRFALVALAIATLALAAAAKPPDLFRLGFSTAVLTGFNDNDAKASLRALTATMARERAIRADPEPLLLDGANAVTTALATAEIDAVATTLDEYWALEDRTILVRFLLGTTDGDPSERYVVVVRRDSGLTNLRDLRGRSLTLHHASRLRIGYFWLEVALARGGAPAAAEFFRHISRSPKFSKAVLDVFFKQSDACLTTRRGFDAMVELNPQRGKQLTAIAASPPLVPALFGFRRGITPERLDLLVSQLSRVHETPAGKQAITIFQFGDLVESPASALADSLAVLDEYRTLRPAAAARLIAKLRASSAGPLGELAP